MGNVEELMTFEKTYYPIQGENSISDSVLAYNNLLMVAREGVTYDIIVSNNDIAFTSRQVLHQPAYGIIYFNSDVPFNPNESVNIVYETT
jgi:hypothetical protein